MRKYKIHVLILISFLIYGNSLLNGFVMDDELQILKNTAVHSINNFPAFFLSSSFASEGMAFGIYYKPLMMTAYSLIYTIFGPQAWAFHLIQIALHISVGILVYLLLKKLLKHDLLAWCLAVVFLVHPINTEVVVSVADYQDVLFLFFGLLSLFVESPIVSALFLLASLLSKETGIIMATITTLYYIIYKRNKLRAFLKGLAGTIFVYAILRFGIAHLPLSKNEIIPIATTPLIGRLITVPAMMLHYLKTFVWPDNLAINQMWVVKEITWTTVYFPLLVDSVFVGLLGYILLALKNAKSKWLQPYLFFLLWFILGLGFHLNLYPLDTTVSDRWFYLPMVGLLGMIGCVYLFASDRLHIYPHVRKLLLSFLIVPFVFFAFLSFQRTFDWRNGLTLSKHDLAQSPNSFLLEFSYGVELLRLKKIDEASLHFQRSIALQPRWWGSYNSLGICYLLKGDYSLAESSYRTAIANGRFYDAYINLGLLLFKEKRYADTVNVLEESALLYPQGMQNPKVLYALTWSYYQLGRKQESLIAASSLLKVDPTQINQEWYQFVKETK